METTQHQSPWLSQYQAWPCTTLEGMMIQRWNNMSEDNDGEFVLFTDHCATLAQKGEEIAKLKHELKQDEYKFIRNHNDYYKELCGMREQIDQLRTELDRVIGENKELRRHLEMEGLEL